MAKIKLYNYTGRSIHSTDTRLKIVETGLTAVMVGKKLKASTKKGKIVKLPKLKKKDDGAIVGYSVWRAADFNLENIDDFVKYLSIDLSELPMVRIFGINSAVFKAESVGETGHGPVINITLNEDSAVHRTPQAILKPQSTESSFIMSWDSSPKDGLISSMMKQWGALLETGGVGVIDSLSVTRGVGTPESSPLASNRRMGMLGSHVEQSVVKGNVEEVNIAESIMSKLQTDLRAVKDELKKDFMIKYGNAVSDNICSQVKGNIDNLATDTVVSFQFSMAKRDQWFANIIKTLKNG